MLKSQSDVLTAIIMGRKDMTFAHGKKGRYASCNQTCSDLEFVWRDAQKNDLCVDCSWVLFYCPRLIRYARA